MDAGFWQQRWREGKTGFHQDRPTPLLEQYWDAVAAAPGSRVFVPLCGKTLDMPWLAARGHRVLGCELSPMAVAQFFDEHGLEPEMHAAADGVHYAAGPIEIVQGDVFGLDPATVAGCDAVFDRAALIALPPAMRQRYVREVYGKLPGGCRGLLVTLEYPQHEKEGPPFSVTEGEVRQSFGPAWDIDLLERRDILAQQPGFQAEGITALATSAYRLIRR